MNSPKRIKRIALDIGNVLCYVDINDFMEFMVSEEIVDNKVNARGFIDGIQHPQDLGLYNIRQAFYRFKPHLEKKALERIYDKWITIIHPSDAMLGVIDDLLVKNYEFSLLSNIGKDHADVVRQKCDVFKKCHQHFSCEVGARKPTILYYQSFIMHYNGWKGALFFDDREENLKGCEGYLKGILFDLDHYDKDEDAATSFREILTKTYTID